MTRANNIIGSIDDVARALAGARDVVVCGHVSPDGDCLGSTLGLVHALRAAGITTTALKAQDEPVEYGLRFLPGAAELVAACDYAGPVGTFVTVDVPSADRMGDAAAALHAHADHTVTIDHHLGRGDFSDVCYVDPDAPSASLLVWEVVKRMGIEPNAAVATCCYTGLNTDTGRFSFQNATYAAFQAASEMVAAGAEPAVVAREVYQNRSMAALKLEAVALERLQCFEGGACGLTYLLKSDFEALGAVKSDADPIIDLVRSLRGVQVACVLREQEDVVRGSLRAKDDTDVSAIAERIGGGGHRAAAGFTFHGTMDEARALMVDEFTALGARGK